MSSWWHLHNWSLCLSLSHRYLLTGEALDVSGAYGPPRLAVIAASVLHNKLINDLEGLKSKLMEETATAAAATASLRNAKTSLESPSAAAAGASSTAASARRHRRRWTWADIKHSVSLQETALSVRVPRIYGGGAINIGRWSHDGRSRGSREHTRNVGIPELEPISSMTQSQNGSVHAVVMVQQAAAAALSNSEVVSCQDEEQEVEGDGSMSQQQQQQQASSPQKQSDSQQQQQRVHAGLARTWLADDSDDASPSCSKRSSSPFAQSSHLPFAHAFAEVAVTPCRRAAATVPGCGERAQATKLPRCLSDPQPAQGTLSPADSSVYAEGGQGDASPEKVPPINPELLDEGQGVSSGGMMITVVGWALQLSYVQCM